MITVIGLDGSPLPPAAMAALAGASLVAGGRRHLLAAPPPPGARTLTLGPVAPAVAALAAHQGDAVVLASGDPGFFGILRCLREHGLDPVVLPGRSSVSLAFARAGLPWDDAMVASAHGRDPRHTVNLCRAHPKVAVLTGPGCGPAELGAALTGWQRQFVVGERLGTPDERITRCSAADAGRREWADPNVVLALAGQGGEGAQPAGGGIRRAASGQIRRAAAGHAQPAAPGRALGSPAAPGPAARPAAATGPSLGWPPGSSPAGWALPEDDFGQRDSVITKAEVRALVLARLGPGPGRLVWDVGAGSGSVGVECARFGAAVVAVERDPRRCELVRGNARRHGVDVRVVEGTAPGALAGLPEPDAVFTGGGGTAVVAAVAARRPARIVVALAAVERVAPVHAALTSAGYAVEGTLLQAARLSPLPGGVHRLGAVNPVFVLWADSSPVRILPAAGAKTRTDHRTQPGEPR